MKQIIGVHGCRKLVQPLQLPELGVGPFFAFKNFFNHKYDTRSM